MKQLRHRAGKEKHSYNRGETIVNGSRLPTHSDCHMSTISGKQINVSTVASLYCPFEWIVSWKRPIPFEILIVCCDVR